MHCREEFEPGPENVPDGQDFGEEDPMEQNEPAGQGNGWNDPMGQYEPAGHNTESITVGQYRPPVQLSQRTFPPQDTHEPSGQGRGSHIAILGQ